MADSDTRTLFNRNRQRFGGPARQGGSSRGFLPRGSETVADNERSVGGFISDPVDAPGDAIALAQNRVSRGRAALGFAGFDAQRRQEDADAAELSELTSAVEDFEQFQSFSDEDFEAMARLRYAQTADSASRDMLEQGGMANAMLGATGMIGGNAAATAAGLERARFGQIVEGQRRNLLDLKQMKMQADAQDAKNILSARAGLAQTMGKDVPTLDVETIQSILELDLAQLGILVGERSARHAADAASEPEGLLGLGGLFGFL